MQQEGHCDRDFIPSGNLEGDRPSDGAPAATSDRSVAKSKHSTGDKFTRAETVMPSFGCNVQGLDRSSNLRIDPCIAFDGGCNSVWSCESTIAMVRAFAYQYIPGLNLMTMIFLGRSRIICDGIQGLPDLVGAGALELSD